MDMKLTQQFKHIAGLPLFDQLKKEDISLMLAEKIICIIQFDTNEMFIKEKSFDRRIFMTLKGCVRISKELLVEDFKHSKELKTLEGKGHLLGEVAAFTGKPRTASVTATCPTVCVVIDISLLMETASHLLDSIKSKFYPSLFELLCRRLDESNESLVIARQLCEIQKRNLKKSAIERMEMRERFQEDLQQKMNDIVLLQQKLEEKG